MSTDLMLSIEGMHCDACVRRVMNALVGVKGVRVESVKVGAATVEFDPVAATSDEIVAAVDRIGFKAHINS
jgi:copper chaperone